MKKYWFILFIAVILFIGWQKSDELIIPYSNSLIEYSGRIDTIKNTGVNLYWSGSSVKINFEGSEISATLKDQTGNNYYNVIIDNSFAQIIRPDTTQKTYLLASNLPNGKHSAEIFKRTEYNRGKTIFFNFILSSDAKALSASPKKLKMEFYGNSITAGYAVEDFSGKDSPDSTYTNNYLSYACLTARHYDAAYSCICRSGIGVMVSWPRSTPNIMPEIYHRLIPTDSSSKWTFSNYTPNIVVVDLLQNDSWLVNMPTNEAFKKRFGSKAPDENFIVNAYKTFISKLRIQYPNASIICMLGNMDITKKDSKWIWYVERAVKELNDKKVYSFFIPYKGSNGHPTIKEQEDMSRSLVEFIDKNSLLLQK